MTLKEQIQEKPDVVRTKIAIWAIVISIISFIMSAFITFRPFFYKEKIVIEAANELSITEDWGNLNFYQYFEIRNNGKKQGVITSIDGLIVSKDGQNFDRKIFAGYYGYNNYYPIIDMSINPDERMEYYFQLFSERSKEDKDSMTYYLSKRSDEIEKKEKDSKWDYTPKEVDSTTYAGIRNFVLKRYEDFKEGKYQYVVAFKKNNEKEPFYIQCYDFVIYKSDLQVLENAIKNYRMEGGSSALIINTRQCSIAVKLTPIEDNMTKMKLIGQLYGNKQ
jgi:hypothetical protein